MPDLSESTVSSLQSLLIHHLEKKGSYPVPEFIDAGGSAAVFKVHTPEGPRAFKVFDPKFLQDERSAAELNRLALQKQLIDHECPFLIKTYSVDIDSATAFIEMEFIEWPQLKKVLKKIPDENVSSIIGQLITAVKYLEQKNIVHRDIKPENIHISPDYKNIVLLDLGVARKIDSEPDGAITDQGGTRPFIATAQYSSPEYLFRLDAPSKELWHGLNIYQVGAVLHDLIMKKEIFEDDVRLENRWLIARSVLSKPPSFDDASPARLCQLKALASRCLSKDIETRVKTVTWDDFLIEPNSDPLTGLRQAIVNSRLRPISADETEINAKLEWERAQHWAKLSTNVRSTIQNACKAELPSRVIIPSTSSSPLTLNFPMTDGANNPLNLTITATINWLDHPQSRNANISIGSVLYPSESEKTLSDLPLKAVCSTTIDFNLNEDATSVSTAIAATIQKAIAVNTSSTDIKDPIYLSTD